MSKTTEAFALCEITPADNGRMDWEDIAREMSEVLKRAGLPAPEVGECNRPAMKKVLAGMLDLEKDSAKLMALLNGGVDNWDFYYDSLKDYGFFEEYPNG